MKNGFFRGHGLGNDYVVMDPTELTFTLTPGKIRGICDRHWGLGSDGILALVPSKKADFGLRIYNPDGSEAEKSGNGLRIFARYLHATGKTKKRAFTVETKGGLVSIALHIDRHGDAAAATVEMGRATFQPSLRDFQTTRRNLDEGRAPRTGARARKPSSLPETDQRPTCGAHRPQRNLYSDLGTRCRRNAGLRIVFLRGCQRRRPSRAGEGTGHGQDARRHAQHRSRPGLQPYDERPGGRGRPRRSESIVCARTQITSRQPSMVTREEIQDPVLVFLRLTDDL